MLELDLIQTTAFAGAVLFLGYGIRRIIPGLARYNIPAPVIGGLIVALAMWALRDQGTLPIKFDTTLQSPLMIAFFTSIGFGASLSLMKVDGPQVRRAPCVLRGTDGGGVFIDFTNAIIITVFLNLLR